MKKISFLLLGKVLVLPVMLIACASPGTKSTTPADVSGSDRFANEHEKKLAQEKKQEQRDRERLLAKKTQSAEIPIVANPQNKKIIIDPNLLPPATDTQLYEQMVNRFQTRDEAGFETRFSMMMNKFPKSPLVGDSLYLAGLMQANLKNYGKALRYFGRLEREYPLNHQVAAALFAKANVYSKMNLPSLAKTIFARVRDNYPGSPESARAAVELRRYR